MCVCVCVLFCRRRLGEMLCLSVFTRAGKRENRKSLTTSTVTHAHGERTRSEETADHCSLSAGRRDAAAAGCRSDVCQ